MSACCTGCEAAVLSFLSPDAAERNEAAITRRLDRLSRQAARTERDLQKGASILREIPDDVGAPEN